MTAYFLDSSALIKRYLPETGSSWLRFITMPGHGNTIFVAQITSIEIVSGVMRRKREGSISLRNAQTIRLLVDRQITRDYFAIGLTTQVDEQAKNLLENYPLRAYDSVQLASAIEGRTRLAAANLPPPVFVSSDNRLLEAAAGEGFTVDDPNLHP